MKKLRTGVAGVGGLGKVHLERLLKFTDRIEVCALADPIPERRAGQNLTADNLNIDLGNKKAVSAANVRSYDDYSGLCRDRDIDFVVIAMPTDLHAPGAVMALENGKHVFTEKPMALSVRACRRMLDAAKANKRKLMVGQVLRFWPEYMEAKRIMKSGRYGKTLGATMRRYGARPRTGWFTQHERSGGVKLDLHIHDVDAALWWWGKPASISSRTLGSTKAVSAVLSQWKYRNGMTAHIEAMWDVGTPFAADFRIIMEKATIEYNMCNDKGLLITTEAGTVPAKVKKACPYEREVSYLIDCIQRNRKPAYCPPEESALAVKYSL